MKTTTKKSKDLTVVRRAGFALLWAGNLAVSAYLAILVAQPDTGQYILGSISAVSAVYFFIKLLK